MAYSIMRSCIQFGFPLMVVFAVYASIYIRIKDRPNSARQDWSARPNSQPKLDASPSRHGLGSSLLTDQSPTNLVQQESITLTDSAYVVSKRLYTLRNRRRRANIMMLSIAIVFFVSWLPLNSINIALEFRPDLFGDENIIEGQKTDIHTISE